MEINLHGYVMINKNCSSDASDNTSDTPEMAVKKERKAYDSSCSTASDIDNTETYHLKPEFLKRYNISPPLTEWVRVSNFRCDKWELREVLELAGHVVSCSVNLGRDKHANVMYSHPLEAVQAITMLNNQKFYGLNLKITMIKCPYDTVLIPKSLTNIGPGFGAFGKPLRDLVKEYDKFVNRQPSLLNKYLFQSIDTNTTKDDNEKQPSTVKKHNINFKKDLKEDDNKSEGTTESMDLDNNILHTKTLIIKNIDEVDHTYIESDDDGENIDNKNKINMDDNSFNNLNKDVIKKNLNKGDHLDIPNDQRLNVSANTFNNSLPLKSVATTGCRGTERQASFPAPYVPVKSLEANTSLSASNESMSRPDWSMGNNYEKSMGSITTLSSSGSNKSLLDQSSITNSNTQMSGPSHSWPRPGPISGFSSPMLGPNTMSSVNRSMSGPISTAPTSAFITPMPGFNLPMAGPNYRPNTSPIGIGPTVGFNSLISGSNSSMSGPILRMSSSVGFSPNCSTPASGSQVSMPAPQKAISNSSTIELRNLPLSTTFLFLGNKLSLYGQVISLQFTTPGCAVVRFGHPSQAQKCFEYFNGMCAEGCVVEAIFI